MARYIDADELNDEYYELFHHGTMAVKMALPVFVDLLDKQPTADVVEVKHGEWTPIVMQDNYLEPPYCDTIKCSECGQEADVSFHDAKYCFNCGAKMDGRSDNNA